MFNLDGTFLCQNGDTTRHAKPIYTNNGWVPTITACCQDICDADIAKMENQSQIPRVTGMRVDGTDGVLSVTWKPSCRYLTEIQIKQGDGEWETLPLYDIGTAHA